MSSERRCLGKKTEKSAFYLPVSLLTGVRVSAMPWKEVIGSHTSPWRKCACVLVWVLCLLCPFIGLQVAKNATTNPSSISEREASIKFQFFLLSASWPPWNLIIVMYCPKCSPRPGHKRQPIPLLAKLSEEYWSYFKPFDSVSQENFLNVPYYSRNDWTHKLWMERVGQSRSLRIILFSTWQSSSLSELKGFATRRLGLKHFVLVWFTNC